MQKTDNVKPKKLSREYDDLATCLSSNTRQAHLTDNLKAKPCYVCGELTNLQLAALYDYGRPGNMIYQTRPAHKKCVGSKIGKWSFIEGA